MHHISPALLASKIIFPVKTFAAARIREIAGPWKTARHQDWRAGEKWPYKSRNVCQFSTLLTRPITRSTGPVSTAIPHSQLFTCESCSEMCSEICSEMCAEMCAESKPEISPTVNSSAQQNHLLRVRVPSGAELVEINAACAAGRIPRCRIRPRHLLFIHQHRHLVTKDIKHPEIDKTQR
jgi:hypothetical protein